MKAASVPTLGGRYSKERTSGTLNSGGQLQAWDDGSIVYLGLAERLTAYQDDAGEEQDRYAGDMDCHVYLDTN